MRARAGLPAVALMLAAAAILLVTMGIRQSLGLFILPIVATTGLSIVSISFALAIGQLIWGVAQPLLGAIADEYGAYRVMIGGALLLAAGCALAPFNTSEPGFVASLGLLLAAGAAAGSFAILIGSTAQYLPADKRSMAAGIINAGGSLGQFLFAPPVQLIIGRSGWGTAMFALSGAALVTVPLAWLFRGNDRSARTQRRSSPLAAGPGLRAQLQAALQDRSYWYLHAGFFTCGFHIAFLVTHLPGDLQMCGLPAGVAARSLALIGLCNVGGSLSAGWLGGRFRMKNILALTYAARAAIVVCYLVDAQVRRQRVPGRSRLRLHLARHRAADRGACRQALWSALSHDALWPDAAVTPARRLPRGMARRSCHGAARLLPVGVVRRHRTGAGGGAHQPADPGSAAAARVCATGLRLTDATADAAAAIDLSGTLRDVCRVQCLGTPAADPTALTT